MNSILNVIEPLCKATERNLRPLDLKPNEYLLLDISEDGQWFIPKPRRLENWTNSDQHEVETDDGIKYVAGYASSYDATATWIYRIPERKGLAKLAATDYTALVIKHAWPEDRIIFSSKAAAVTFEFLVSRFMFQTARAVMAANFKINGTQPKMHKEFVEHPDLPLVDYQKAGLHYSLFQDNAALFMEQGTGKTPIPINRMCLEAKLKRKGELMGFNKGIYRVLVICPSHLRANWEKETTRFCTSPGKIAVLRGGNIARSKLVVEAALNDDDCDWSMSIISVDSVALTMEVLSLIPWDLLILDESQDIKSPTTRRSMACRSIAGKLAKQKMVLTGTPIGNTVFDLWAQLEFLGEGLSGFSDFKRFCAFHGIYTEKDSKGSAIQKLIGFKGIPLIQERLARVAFMLTKKESGMKLPEKLYNLVEVEMSATQKQVYSQMAMTMIAEINLMLEDNHNIKMTTNNALTKLLRLSQICSGFIKSDEVLDDFGEVLSPSKVSQIDEVNPKVEQLVKLIQDENRDPKGKAIVWCTFIEDMRIVSERLTQLGIKHIGYHKVINPECRVSDAKKAEEVFNKDPDVKVFIGNPQSGGVGLNLVGYDYENPDESDTFTDLAVFFSVNWSFLQRSQAEDRCHRMGTRQHVVITDLLVPGSIDEEIRAKVNEKGQKSFLIQDIRDILKRMAV